MAELLMDKAVEVEKSLVKTFSKKEVHCHAGVCFDKKDTYTISEEVSKFGCHKPFTINTILSLANVKLSEDKQTVIVARLIDNDSYYTERNIVKYNYVYLTIDTDKKVTDFWGDYCCGKGVTLEQLRECYCAIVIQADINSLKFPNKSDKDRNYQDIFDFKDTNKRIVFDKKDNYVHVYNKETDKNEKRYYTYDEMMSMQANKPLYVRFKDTGVKFSLDKTWSKLNESLTWADYIDKSGYNKAKAQWNLETRLEKYKADKIRKNIVSGNSKIFNLMAQLEVNITDCHNLIKQEFCKADINDLERFCGWRGYADKLKDVNNRKETLKAYINRIGTDEERTYQTLDLENDINETITRIEKLIDVVKNKSSIK